MSSAGWCLTLALALLACRGDANPVRDSLRDTILPVGAGTEVLLTRERLVVIGGWIQASIARTGRVPASLDEVRPPDDEASRYVPLERFLRDGWGRPIEYEVEEPYTLRSVGEDGVSGTGDDITLSGDYRVLPGRGEVPSLPLKR